MLNYIIRPAVENDFSAILSLIKELALFEKAPEKVTNTVELMKKEKNFFKVWVAEKEDKEIIGFALFYYVYYTWVGKSLYLDDLYVKENYRGNAVGKKLLDKIIKIGKENDCKRIRWQVLGWNKPAIEFYKKKGAFLDDEWINCDLEKL